MWQIQFENNYQIWIAAFEIEEDSEPYYSADNLTVFFCKQDVEKYKLEDSNAVSVLNTSV